MNSQLKSALRRAENASKARLSDPARAMYLAKKVSLSRAEEVSRLSNNGKGWVTRQPERRKK